MEEEAAVRSDAAMRSMREELSVGEIDPNDVVFAAHFEMRQRVVAVTDEHEHELLDESYSEQQQPQRNDDAWRFSADIQHTYAQRERRHYRAVETREAADAYYSDYDDEYDDDDEGDDDLVHSSWSTEKEQLTSRLHALDTGDSSEDAAHENEDIDDRGNRYDHEAAATAAATDDGDGDRSYDATYRRLAFLNDAFSGDDNDNDDDGRSSNGDDRDLNDSATDDDALLEFHDFIHATRQHARRLAAQTDLSNDQYDHNNGEYDGHNGEYDDKHGEYDNADEQRSHDDGVPDASQDASHHAHNASEHEAEATQLNDSCKDGTVERHEQQQQREDAGRREDAAQDSGDDDESQNDAADHATSDDRAFALSTSRMSESQHQQSRGFQHSHFTLSAFSTATTADGADDEWQEAYTAKGRVYYYNRRTRESSWKRCVHRICQPLTSSCCYKLTHDVVSLVPTTLSRATRSSRRRLRVRSRRVAASTLRVRTAIRPLVAPRTSAARSLQQPPRSTPRRRTFSSAPSAARRPSERTRRRRTHQNAVRSRTTAATRRQCIGSLKRCSATWLTTRRSGRSTTPRRSLTPSPSRSRRLRSQRTHQTRAMRLPPRRSRAVSTCSDDGGTAHTVATEQASCQKETLCRRRVSVQRAVASRRHPLSLVRSSSSRNGASASHPSTRSSRRQRQLRRLRGVARALGRRCQQTLQVAIISSGR